MGGLARTRSFFRAYEIPGMGHCAGIGSVNGQAGTSPPAAPPLPKPGQLYRLLVAWVEDRQPPEAIALSNASGTLERPICPAPEAAAYQSGDPAVASSYACRAIPSGAP
jgi:feruloyl esterase